MKLHGDKDVVVSASQDATAKVWTCGSADWTSPCPGGWCAKSHGLAVIISNPKKIDFVWILAKSYQNGDKLLLNHFGVTFKSITCGFLRSWNLVETGRICWVEVLSQNLPMVPGTLACTRSTSIAQKWLISPFIHWESAVLIFWLNSHELPRTDPGNHGSLALLGIKPSTFGVKYGEILHLCCLKHPNLTPPSYLLTASLDKSWAIHDFATGRCVRHMKAPLV